MCPSGQQAHLALLPHNAQWTTLQHLYPHKGAMVPGWLVHGITTTPASSVGIHHHHPQDALHPPVGTGASAAGLSTSPRSSLRVDFTFPRDTGNCHVEVRTTGQGTQSSPELPDVGPHPQTLPLIISWGSRNRDWDLLPPGQSRPDRVQDMLPPGQRLGRCGLSSWKGLRNGGRYGRAACSSPHTPKDEMTHGVAPATQAGPPHSLDTSVA